MSITPEEARAAGLSQEEIDAINGHDPAEDTTALEEIAGDDEGDDGDEGDDAAGGGVDDGDDDQAGSQAAGAAQNGEDGAGQGAVEQAAGGQAAEVDDDPFAAIPEDLPAVNFTPKLSGELLPEYAQATDAAYDKADKRLEEIEAKFEEGELSAAERREQTRQVERERDAEIRKLSAASQNAEIEGQRWQAEQAVFFRANGTYLKNAMLYNALNAEVVRLAGAPEAAGKSGMEILYAAKAVVDAAVRAITGAATPTTPQPKKDATPSKPRASMPDVKTLADVPAAAAPEVGQDRFAHLDKLVGLELEAAIARMSEPDKAAYLAGR
jgi:hypothetical protein